MRHVTIHSSPPKNNIQFIIFTNLWAHFTENHIVDINIQFIPLGCSAKLIWISNDYQSGRSLAKNKLPFIKKAYFFLKWMIAPQ